MAPRMYQLVLVIALSRAAWRSEGPPALDSSTSRRVVPESAVVTLILVAILVLVSIAGISFWLIMCRPRGQVGSQAPSAPHAAATVATSAPVQTPTRDQLQDATAAVRTRLLHVSERAERLRLLTRAVCGWRMATHLAQRDAAVVARADAELASADAHAHARAHALRSEACARAEQLVLSEALCECEGIVQAQAGMLVAHAERSPASASPRQGSDDEHGGSEWQKPRSTSSLVVAGTAADDELSGPQVLRQRVAFLEHRLAVAVGGSPCCSLAVDPVAPRYGGVSLAGELQERFRMALALHQTAAQQQLLVAEGRAEAAEARAMQLEPQKASVESELAALRAAGETAAEEKADAVAAAKEAAATELAAAIAAARAEAAVERAVAIDAAVAKAEAARNAEHETMAADALALVEAAAASEMREALAAEQLEAKAKLSAAVEAARSEQMAAVASTKEMASAELAAVRASLAAEQAAAVEGAAAAAAAAAEERAAAELAAAVEAARLSALAEAQAVTDDALAQAKVEREAALAELRLQLMQEHRQRRNELQAELRQLRSYGVSPSASPGPRSPSAASAISTISVGGAVRTPPAPRTTHGINRG